jgi:hypothetical protein
MSVSLQELLFCKDRGSSNRNRLGGQECREMCGLNCLVRIEVSSCTTSLLIIPFIPSVILLCVVRQLFTRD